MDSAARQVSAPLQPAPDNFEPGTALLIADPQNAFLHPDGSMAQLGLPTQRMRLALRQVRTLAYASRTAGMPVFLLQMWIEDYDSAGILLDHFPPLRDLRHCAAGSWDAQISEKLECDGSEIVVRHSRFSGFHKTELEARLEGSGVRSLILAGFPANTVVESTARSAFDRDMNVYLPREAVASYTPEMEEASLLNLSLGIARVVDLGSVLRGLRKSAQAQLAS